jgi:uncharacterized damage-inducible protein DinB
MKRILWVVLAAAPMMVQAQTVWMKAATGQYERYKLNLNETAQAMPEADYEFKLTAAQRPFSGWIEHTAVMLYGACANIQGVAAPEAAKHVEHAKGKEALSKALAESFAYCDGAIAKLDAAKAEQEIVIGTRKVVPATVLVNLIASLNEHYGNLVGYMRSKGIVPPTTARANAASQKKN